MNEAKLVKILVVDDTEVVRNLVRRQIARPGRLVEVALNGKEALRKLKQGYDLLVVDKEMPEMNGLELIRMARALNPKVRTILMTAYSTEESKAEALRMGVDVFVTKPFNMQEFMKQVDALLLA